MIICSCNVLSQKQLREAAEEMRTDPNGKVPTPGAVFRHLGCRPRCGGCFPAVIDTIHEKGSEETKDIKPAAAPLKRVASR